jgi:tetratricopeptide (TPR) repeat protein
MAVLAVVFSLLLNPADLSASPGGMPSFFRLAQQVLILIIVGTVIYAVLLGVLRPVAVDRQRDAVADSQIAQDLLERAQASEVQNEYRDAVRAYEAYLVLDPDNAHVMSELDAARAAVQSTSGGGMEAASEEFTPLDTVTGLSVGELITRAQQFLQDEEYFSAHYYASQALGIDPDSPQARQIAARARQALQSPTPSEEEEAAADFFKRKRDGYMALYENDDPITAYYIFKSLRDDRGRDPDVQRYYQEALEAVREISFFIGEAQENVDLPGSFNIMTRYRDADDATILLWVDKIVMGTGGTYFYGIEALSSRDGELDYHFAAEYGKMVGQVLNMRGIDQDVPQRRKTPQYFRGSRAEEEMALLRIPISIDALMRASYADTGMEKAGVLALLDMRESFAALGHRVEPVYRELLERLIMPFAFVVLSILAVALGWQWRSRSLSRPSVLVLAMAPLAFVIAYWITTLYTYLHRSVITLLVARAEPLIATLLIVFLEFLLLVLALIVFAGQKAR